MAEEQLITLCADCAERMRESYVLTDLGWAPGCCTWMSCSNAPVRQYNFISKADLYRRQHFRPQRSRDTRAYYRGSWREDV